MQLDALALNGSVARLTESPDQFVPQSSFSTMRCNSRRSARMAAKAAVLQSSIDLLTYQRDRTVRGGLDPLHAGCGAVNRGSTVPLSH